MPSAKRALCALCKEGAHGVLGAPCPRGAALCEPVRCCGGRRPRGRADRWLLVACGRTDPPAAAQIVFNAHDAAAEFVPTDMARVVQFRDSLVEAGCLAYIRRGTSAPYTLSHEPLTLPLNALSPTL